MKYRAEIDGLRALAVVPVVLYHAGASAFGGGYVGVDVFFVISGYLITTIIAEDLSQGQFSLHHFYERRARRILPMLFVVMLSILPFCWFWLMPRELEKFVYSIPAVITFTSNFFFWDNSEYFESTAELQPLLHTWSVAVEEQYYIVFPLIMLLIWRKSVASILAIALIASLIFAEWTLRIDAASAFFLLPFRTWELLIGALTALYLLKQGQPPVSRLGSDALALGGVVLIVTAIFAYDPSTQFPGLNAVPPTVGTAMVILFARDDTFAQRMLSLKPFVWIGLISYGTYLWHQPVFALFKHRFGIASFTEIAWLLIILSFALAYVSHQVVEQPFRNRLSRRTLTWSLILALMATMTTATFMHLQVRDRPNSIPSYRWALANAEEELLRYAERRNVRMECGKPNHVGVETCAFGDPKADVSLVLWGDSLAGALLSGMDLMAREAGLHGIAYIANACPPVPGLASTREANCKSGTHEDILSRINAMPEVTDIVITGNLAGATKARNITIDGNATSYFVVKEKLSTAVTSLRVKGIRVIILEQGPLFEEDVSSYLMQNLRQGDLKAMVVDKFAHIESLKEVRDLAGVADIYIETTNFFCDENTCPSVDKQGKMIVYDRNHVTREYSAQLARFLAQAAGF